MSVDQHNESFNRRITDKSYQYNVKNKDKEREETVHIPLLITCAGGIGAPASLAHA